MSWSLLLTDGTLGQEAPRRPRAPGTCSPHVPSSSPVSFFLRMPTSWAPLLGEELEPHTLHPCSLAPDVFHTHPAAMSTRTLWEGVATDLLGA